MATFFGPSSRTASDIVETVTRDLKSLQDTIAPLVGKEPYDAANKVLEACSQSIFSALLETPDADVKPINPGTPRS